MLSVTRLQSPQDRQKKLESEIQSGPLLKTWVVSDLRSKFETQKQILAHHGFYEDLDVLRASELWRLLLRRIRPDIRVVSPDLIRAMVKDQVESLDLPLGSTADQAICDFMDQFSPVIFHPRGAEQLREWFQDNPRSYQRWGSWYRLAEQFAPHFLEKKMISPAWVSAVLLSQLDEKQSLEKIWQKQMVFDLGCDLTQTESDLIQFFSRQFDCEVLRPEPLFHDRYKALLTPYDHMPVQKEQTLAVSPLGQSQKKTFRFSGMLAEVKHSVAQIRLWLEQGVPTEKIAVLAPDIEAYWPALSEFLVVEGIAVQKERTSRLQSLPVVHQWISAVRVRSGLLEPGQIEIATYGPELGIDFKMRFEEFHSLFKNILGPEDLTRVKEIESHFGTRLKGDQKMTVEIFLGAILPFWKRMDLSEVLEGLLKDFLSKLAGDENFKSEMRLSNWLYLLERIISKKEVRVGASQNNGIVVANFADGESLLCSHRIFLGLTQAQLKAKSISWILPSEIHSFNQNHGFYLLDPESSRASFELQWLGLASSQEDHFCFPGTTWEGNIETPAQIWMEMRGSEKLHQVDVPEQTRWDEIQAAVTEDDVERNSPRMIVNKTYHLSASSFQRFRDCPFIFFAEKGLGLMDPPEVDLDLDRRTKGRLIHSVLEQIMDPSKALSWTEPEIRQLLENERLKLPPGFIHENLWGPLRERSVSLALRFQDQEKVWRVQYPQSRVLGREIAFDFQYRDFRFKGVIDRIDGDEKRAVILDYKTSESAVRTFAKWYSENQLQLGFYTWILEKGFIQELGVKNVTAAFFYVLKTLDRSTGFKTTEGDGLFDTARRKSQISVEAKNEFLQLLETEIHLITQKILAGEFLPAPRDLEICDNCRWRGLCRAPHLN